MLTSELVVMCPYGSHPQGLAITPQEVDPVQTLVDIFLRSRRHFNYLTDDDQAELAVTVKSATVVSYMTYIDPSDKRYLDLMYGYLNDRKIPIIVPFHWYPVDLFDSNFKLSFPDSRLLFWRISNCCGMANILDFKIRNGI